MNWITENFTTFLTDIIGGTIDLFGEWLNNMFFWIVELALYNDYVVNAEKFIIATAVLLISIIVIKIITSGYLLETDYDSEADPFNLIIKIAQTVAIILNAGWMFDWMLGTSKMYLDDMLGGEEIGGFCEQTKALLHIHPSELGDKLSAYVIMLGIIVIAFIVFSVICGLRGAELIAMKLFMPYFALDLLTNSRERWKNFFTAYIIAFFSYSIQVLFFIIALKSYASVSMYHGNYYIVTLIWTIMAIRAPKFLEKFLYQSGVSNAASGGIRMIAQTIVMRGAVK